MDNPYTLSGSVLEFQTNYRPVRLRIQIAQTQDDIDRWLEQNVKKELGFDIEWRPNFTTKTPQNKASLMQLSAGDKALLIRLMVTPPTTLLASVLIDETIQKAGVGIQDDGRKILADWNLQMNGLIDIGEGMSLKRIAAARLGISLTKNKKICRSDWALRELSTAQIIYAALDAWVGAECLARINEKPV